MAKKGKINLFLRGERERGLYRERERERKIERERTVHTRTVTNREQKKDQPELISRSHKKKHP